MFTRRPGSRHNRGRIASARRALFDVTTAPGYELDISADFVAQSGTISAFIDQSGKGHDFAQGTPASMPTYSATGWVDGTPAAVFDGSDDCVTCTDSFADTVAGGDDATFSLYVLTRVTTAGAGRYVISFGRSSTDTPFLGIAGTSALLNVRQRDDAGGILNGNTGSVSGYHLLTVVHTASQRIFRVDGVPVTPGSQTLGTTTFDQASVGCLFRTTNSDFMAQTFKRYLAYTEAHDAATYAAIEASLMAEHGL